MARSHDARLAELVAVMLPGLTVLVVSLPWSRTFTRTTYKPISLCLTS
jgi:hypothetical protein